MPDDAIASFIASTYEPRFTRAARRAYGIQRGEKVGTFILARREWDAEWEIFATRALSDALKTQGLSEVQLLAWRSRPSALGLHWEFLEEARGDAAEIRWAEMALRAEEEFRTPPFTMLMWSSVDGATRALAEMEWSDTDDLGYPPDTGWWVDSREEAPLRVVVLFVWGPKRVEVLAALDSAASEASMRFRKSKSAD